MDNINDNNFKELVEKEEKLVLADFYAQWCPPCREMMPAIEKVAEELKDHFVFAKIDIDKMPKTANSYGVTGVPFVALLKKGEVIDSFLGSRLEGDIREWLKEYTSSTERGFVCQDAILEYEDYASNHDFRLNPDKKVVEGIVAGLLRNEDVHGERYCPCRRVVGDENEDKKIICPCIYHKEEIDNDGRCTCGLFVR